MRTSLQLTEERLELVQIGAELVHLAQCARDLDERAVGVGRERLEPLLRALELAAEDQLARPTLLGELPQLRLGDGLIFDDRPKPLLQRGVQRLGDRVPPYIPIEWYPESTYSVVPVTFFASSESR